MKNYYSYLSKALKRSLLFAAVAWTGSTNVVNAQNLDPQKMAAVMTIINMYLFEEEDTKTEIVFGAFDDSYFRFSEQFDAEFDGQTTDIELCFILTSSSSDLSEDVSVSLNGQGSLDVHQGENCFVVSVGQQQGFNNLKFTINTPGISVLLRRISVERAQQSQLTLPVLTRSNWDEKAVRKVLKIFAFGGHARDSQIIDWADMPPRVAIKQMLNFSQHNFKLSPLARGEQYRQTASIAGRLTSFSTFLSSPTSKLPIPISERRQFRSDEDNFETAFYRMATTRGLNPFRQRIGFWETNYHLAVNLDTAVNRPQIARYYDDIMNAHEASTGYNSVMAAAARAAAPAMQYGHRNNVWDSG